MNNNSAGNKGDQSTRSVRRSGTVLLNPIREQPIKKHSNFDTSAHRGTTPLVVVPQDLGFGLIKDMIHLDPGDEHHYTGAERGSMGTRSIGLISRASMNVGEGGSPYERDFDDEAADTFSNASKKVFKEQRKDTSNYYESSFKRIAKK